MGARILRDPKEIESLLCEHLRPLCAALAERGHQPLAAVQDLKAMTLDLEYAAAAAAALEAIRSERPQCLEAPLVCRPGECLCPSCRHSIAVLGS
ncbi:MAG: hypothetical protein RML12_07820 [Xanthomonadales bacterium]|nr:hypothetical protein [Xanthomonadales bacterium]